MWQLAGKYAARVAALSIVMALTACGGGGSSSPTASTPAPAPAPVSRSVLTVTVAPNPLIATATGDPTYPWQVEYEVTVRETAGLACNINRLQMSFRSGTTGLEFGTETYDPNYFNAYLGGNHIPALGSKTVKDGWRYRLAFGGKQMTIYVAAEAIDARGNTVTASTQVNVLMAGGAVELER